jgi:hypothetical protein
MAEWSGGDEGGCVSVDLGGLRYRVAHPSQEVDVPCCLDDPGRCVDERLWVDDLDGDCDGRDRRHFWVGFDELGEVCVEAGMVEGGTA